MSTNTVSTYRAAIEGNLRVGNATESTHRPALKALLESLTSGTIATNEPKRVECGAPDFVISRSPGPLTVGYVETKDVGKSLDEAQHSEQMKRYLHSLGNLILTDYLEFRWYVDGEHRHTARLARWSMEGRLVRERDGGEAVVTLLRDFLSHTPEPISTPKDMAQRMARLTHMVRDIIVEAFDRDKASPLLRDLRKAFATALIPELHQPEKTGEFADMYAQTIAYGLFAARCNHRGAGPFRRLGAAGEIPKTNPFLRRLFETITGTDMDDEPYAVFVDDLVQLLANTDMSAILAQFGRRTRQEDPVVHFYETFLSTYDPKLREMRGVYYTPEPVVSYIVRSVDHLLRTRFGLPQGLADTVSVEYEREDNGTQPRQIIERAPRVLILDPACGTGTFLYAVVDHIRNQFMTQGNAGMWSGYVRQHLLPRIFGFELLVAPYAVAHLKLGMQLAGQDLNEVDRRLWSYDFSGNERLGTYLTNTLEEAEHRVDTLFGPLRVITEEASAATHIKRDLPIMVILGNPPYSGHSANRSWEVKNGKQVLTFIGKLVRDYYLVDGHPLEERQSKWLQDDYVKFIRWAQWRIERTGAGVLAFITNNGYLDNPTFRGMRRALMNAFTDIYILDLHGSSKKKERAPDGSKDENVFDIQQGVALTIFVNEPGTEGPAKIFHSDLWGLRESKYECLLEKDIQATEWKQLQPQAPFYLFVPRDIDLLAEYQKGWKVTDIFPVNSVGIVTARDHLTIHWSPQEVWETVKHFASLSEEEARERYALGEDAQHWKVSLAQQDIRGSGPSHSNVVPILYRPFDVRYTYYTGQTRGLICRPLPGIMRQMLMRKNVALVLPRRVEIAGPWMHALVTTQILEHVAVSLKTIDSIFPLYLSRATQNTETRQAQLFDVSPWPVAEDGHLPNLNLDFVRDLEKRLELKFVQDGTGDLNHTFFPDDILHYIYAILHSPTYRSRYAEFLKIDFPRVPLTSERDIFRELTALGKELVALHLLESPTVSNFITRYPVAGDNRVEKGYPKYVALGGPELGMGTAISHGRVYINKTQYFEAVPFEVWEFHVGGYQVCEKWLKDRRGRQLLYDDLTHYQQLIVALHETIRLMGEIDAAIPEWPLG